MMVSDQAHFFSNHGPETSTNYNDMYASNISLDRTSQRSDDGSYHVPPYHQKKERQRQKRVVQGKAHDKCGVKGAPEPSRQLFIYRVHKDTTVEDLELLLSESEYDFEIRALECVSHESATFKSFRLQVPRSQFENLFDGNLWPGGVRVRQYIPRRKDNYHS